MTRIKALRDFFKKFFNYESSAMTITSLIADVTENAEGPSGGGDVKIVNVNVSTMDMETLTIDSIDKTFSEVFDGIMENGESWFSKINVTIAGTYKQIIMMPILAQKMPSPVGNRLYGMWSDMTDVSGQGQGYLDITRVYLTVTENDASIIRLSDRIAVVS